MSRLRIAITADPYLAVPPKLYGGIERVVDFLVRGLTARGHEVTLFAHPESSTAGTLVPYGVPPHVGVNLVRIPAGAMSSQRHCHSKQDEFVFVLEGELVLATDLGEQTLTPGMAAGFPAGSGDGHHLINRTDEDAVYLEVGDRTAGDEGDYPDIDMLIRIVDGKRTYIHRDGKPYK